MRAFGWVPLCATVMASEIALAQPPQSSAKPSTPPPTASQDCSVKPVPDSKPQFASDSYTNVKPAYPQEKNLYATGGFPQDQHAMPKEGPANDQAYPQDQTLVPNRQAFPQDEHKELSGCPAKTPNTHS